MDKKMNNLIGGVMIFIFIMGIISFISVIISSILQIESRDEACQDMGFEDVGYRQRESYCTMGLDYYPVEFECDFWGNCKAILINIMEEE